MGMLKVGTHPEYSFDAILVESVGVDTYPSVVHELKSLDVNTGFSENAPTHDIKPLLLRYQTIRNLSNHTQLPEIAFDKLRVDIDSVIRILRSDSLDVRDRLRSMFRFPRENDDACSSQGKCLGDFVTDAARTARDDGDAASEVHDVLLLEGRAP